MPEAIIEPDLPIIETDAKKLEQIVFNTFDGIEEIQGNILSNTKIIGTANADVIDMRDIVVMFASRARMR